MPEGHCFSLFSWFFITFHYLSLTGLENYPYPVMPEGQGNSQLSRTEEKQSLQHLNNRLAGYIDKVMLVNDDDNDDDDDDNDDNDEE